MVGEGVEPCNIAAINATRYRCDHQPFAKIKRKVEYSKYNFAYYDKGFCLFLLCKH